MTTDNKKILYGAARINAIRKTENDAMDDCRELMHKRGLIPVIGDDGKLWAVPVRQVIVSRLATASSKIERLKAGMPV